MTEYVVDDEKYIWPAPSELRETGVLAEPLTIAEKSMRQVWEIQERLPWECRMAAPGAEGQRGYCHKAVVLGAGAVGLLGAMLLRRQGFETVVYSRESAEDVRAGIASEIGAQFVSSADEPMADLARRLGHIDLVYEATGASQFAFEFLEHLGANGVYVFTGVPGRHGPVPLPAAEIMRDMVLKNQIIFGSVNAGPQAYADALSDLAEFHRQWPKPLAALITHRFPLEDFETPLLHPPPGIKNLISIWSEEEE